MTQPRSYSTGYTAAIVSGVLFSIKGVFAKKAYAAGASPEVLLGLRFAFTLPVFAGIAFKESEGRKLSELRGVDWFQVAAVTSMGYVFASLLDFKGLQHVSVGLERLILYLHPTLVVLLAALFLGRSLRGWMIPALILSYIGLVLCFTGEVHVTDRSATLWGALLIFISAAAYAVFMLGAEKLVPRIGVHRLTALGMVLSGIIFPLQAFLREGSGLFHLPPSVYYWSLAMAVFGTVLPVYLFGVGLKSLGASRLSIVSMVGPVVVLPLAALFLGEPAGIFQWSGFGFTVAGGMLLMWKRAID